MSDATASTVWRVAPSVAFLLFVATIVPVEGLVLSTDALVSSLSLVTLAATYGIVGLATASFVELTGLPTAAPVPILGVASYTYLILIRDHDTPQVVAWIGAVVAALAVGSLMAVVALRTRGMAFLMMTFAFAAFIVVILTTARDLTGGSYGTTLPSGALLGSARNQYWLALAVLGVCCALYGWVRRTAAAARMRAVRDNERLARSIGIDPFGVRFTAFLLSSGLVGLGAPILVHQQGTLTPGLFDGLNTGILVYLMIMLGGVTTVIGPVVGAWFVTLLPAWLDDSGLGDPNTQTMIFAATVVGLAVFAPQGIGGALEAALERRRGRHPAAETADLANGWQPSPVASEPVLLTGSAVTKRFGAAIALDRVSVSVAHGECLGVIGPNGSGKTTLLNCLSGFVDPSEGAVVFEGTDVGRLSPSQRSRRGLVRTFQQAEAFATFTAYESCRVAGVDHDDAVRALAMCGLGSDLFTPCSELSYGQLRALNIAVAICTRPRLLLLDEPAAGLTAHEVRELANLITTLRANGMALVVIEHDMGFLAPLCDRMIVLDFGEKIAEGLPDEILRDPRVVEAYLGTGSPDSEPSRL